MWDDGLSGWFELAARHDGDHHVSTWVPTRPDLLDDAGHAQLGALTFAVDAAVGMSAGWSAMPGWIVTTDVDLRLFGPVAAGPMRAEATPLRRGRSQVLVEARVFDEGDDDRLVAAGSANHNILPAAAGVAIDVLPVGVVHRQPSLPHPTPPLHEHFGLLTRAPGVVEAPMNGTTRNPWGILHGALHALLADHARRAIAPGHVESVTVRFAGPVRVGPAVARAQLVGVHADRRAVVRVEVVDAGADDRLGSLTFLGIDLST